MYTCVIYKYINIKTYKYNIISLSNTHEFVPILARIRARWRATKNMRLLRNICEQVANELRGSCERIAKG